MFNSKKYRITVLTSRLIRLEYREDGRFVDEQTQTVLNRNFPSVSYTTTKEDDHLVIETEDLRLVYDEEEFSPEGLSIALKSNGNVWHYTVVYANSDHNLFGTARTLDGADGGIWLEKGIFGEYGYAVMDDSTTAIVDEDGEYKDREGEGLDLYFFGYGKDYAAGLRDFFQLCGSVPMIPRYALGNWWSRYYRYTEESYNQMLDAMEKENIPLSVAVIDMDWHLTQVDEKYGTGWTGYTWDEELFPDYRRFLKNLKKRGLATTLNLHPADGIRAFEVQYEEVAKAMGVDPAEEKAIPFDFSNKAFREAYFQYVMHPYEDEGVDFWWIDWQQGTQKGKSHIDPLFLLNHYHFEDRKRDGNRPMIFSRYAGPGSHRYPLGFSGDTVASWKSLDFQPYFTATASNIGYGWWSHDIGGHMLGEKNDERLIRWIQFGVFSPVMRIHSSCSPFSNKEPWALLEPYRKIMGEFMRLRHRLIPYLYTMNYLAHTKGEMLMQPMYYRMPDCDEAYHRPNEYYFGSELLVGMITKETTKDLQMAGSNMLIPEGRWYDIFHGYIYTEGRRNLYRSVDTIPVLLKAGGIVPLSLEEGNGVANPSKLRLLIGAGASGSFTMYEDDGISMEFENGSYVTTEFTQTYDEAAGKTILTIHAAKGDTSLIPKKRSYEVVVYGLAGEAMQTHILPECLVDGDVTLEIPGTLREENDFRKEAFDILERAWIAYTEKEHIYDLVREAKDAKTLKEQLLREEMDLVLRDAICEFL